MSDYQKFPEEDECLYVFLSQFCALFSNPTRLKILYSLKDGEKTVGDISEILECPIQNISQHLRLMRDRACLLSRKEGKNVYYHISNDRIIEGLELIRGALCEEMQKIKPLMRR